MDYFLVAKEHMDMVQDSIIHNEYFGSDHCPIELKLDITKASKQGTLSKKASKKEMIGKKASVKKQDNEGD